MTKQQNETTKEGTMQNVGIFNDRVQDNSISARLKFAYSKP